MLSTIVVLLLASVTSELAASVRPVVTFTPPWRRIAAWDSVTVACDIGTTAHENEKFYWYRNEKLMDIHQPNFTIQSALEVLNGGDYQCRTTTSDISDPAKLQVIYTYVILQTPPTIYEGDRLTLRCYSRPIYNGTNTTFYKDGEEIQSSVNGSELHIDRVDRRASGTYSCTKTVQLEEFFNQPAEAFVYVRGADDDVKPMVTIIPNWRRTMSMDPITLVCNVGSTAQEKETFYWYKDSKLINCSQQNFIIQSPQWRYGNGFYQCRTSTSDISDPITLDIRKKDLVLEKPTTIYEGDPLTLRCLSRSWYTVLNTTFYKDNRKIKFSISDKELHINKVDRSVTGTYKCVQSLQSTFTDHNGNLTIYKTLSDEIYITVRGVVRPMVTFTPNWRNLLSGDSVILTCDVGSAIQDDQTYYWYKDDKVLNVTQVEFTIQSVTPKDGGEYKCRARSSDMSYPTKLEVTNADVILQQDTSSTYEGNPLTLRCHSHTEYKWINTTFYKDEEEVQFSANESTFRIHQLDRRATGSYKCSQRLLRQDGAFTADSAQIFIYVKDITSVTHTASVRPIVTFTPPWRRIKFGDSVIIACDIGTSAKNETFFWYRNEKLIDIRQQNFTVQSASNVDNGEYQCRSTTSDISDPLWLHVSHADAVLQTTPNVQEGDPLTLRCHNTLSRVDPTFYLEGDEIHFIGPVLHYEKANRNMTGSYQCDINYEDAPGYIYDYFSEAFVYVGGNTVKPLVTFTPNWRNFQEHEFVTLTCNVASTAQELETFSWYRNNKLLSVNEQTFTIEYVTQSEDGGYYQCRTSTSDISEPVKLEVEESDLILQRPTSIYEGDSLTVRCYARFNFRSVNTTFFKDNRQIYFSASDPELRIDVVDRSTIGTYRCTQRLQPVLSFNGISQRFRSESAETHITIRATVRPMVTFTPNWRNLLPGDSVTLTCDGGSTKQDDQTYYWYKDEKVLDVTQQEFTIPSMSRRDGGEYKCRTRSSDMSYPTNLEVSGGPTSEIFTTGTSDIEEVTSPTRTSRSRHTRGTSRSAQTSSTKISDTSSSPHKSSPKVQVKRKSRMSVLLMIGILTGVLVQLIFAAILLVYLKAKRSKRYQIPASPQ